MDSNMEEDYDHYAPPSVWRNGRYVECSPSPGQGSQQSRGQSSQRGRRQSSQPGQPSQSSQWRQGPTSQQQPAPSPRGVDPMEAFTQFASVIQSALKGTPAKEKKPQIQERERLPCLLCASTLATQTTLFRHYKHQHNIPNPARFLGYKESNVVNLDTTLEECVCVCGLAVPNSHALNVHKKAAQCDVNTTANNAKVRCNQCEFEANNRQELDVHSRIHATCSSTANTTVNNAKERCNQCGFEANNRHELDVHSRIHASSSSTANTTVNNAEERCNECGFQANNRQELDIHSRMHASCSNTASNSANVRNTTNVDNASKVSEDPNNNNVNKTLVDSLHKCDECVCYFDDKKRFDEHMKLVHGHIAGCSICNKTYPFKDYYDHVKNNHPDVYNAENKIEFRKERNGVKKLFLRKSGKIVCVYKCTKCNSDFQDENKARRHYALHNRKLKITTVANNTERTDDNVNINESLHDKDILFTCAVCKISTASYEVVVEHSQIHLTDSNVQFATNTCERCNLKFEPICHDQHLRRHYSEDNLNRESFTYLEYKYQLLLSDNWLKAFNFDEAVMQRIESKSIYAHTRSVKMKVISVSGTTTSISNLYQCGKCKRYVDPTSVANHTRNYDTCVRISNENPCEVCKRSFNSPKALENHMKVHVGDESFRIVIFNTERDKEFNFLLNHIHASVNTAEDVSTTSPEEPDSSDSNNNVVYKCQCLLCFVLKKTADYHIKVCPGKDPREACQKCNCQFTKMELIHHYIKNHSANDTTTFTIVNITPDVIEIESDIETEEPSDTGCGDIMEVSDSDGEADVENSNTDTQNAASVSAIEESDTQAEVLPVTAIQDMGLDIHEAMTVELNECNELTDDTDSQGTIVDGGHVETTNDITNTESSQLQGRGLINNKKALKCVPTDYLIYRPSETIRQQIDANGDAIRINSIKKEYAWSENAPSNSTSTIGEVSIYDLLTDDEEPEDPNGEEIANDTKNEIVLNITGNVAPLNNFNSDLNEISPVQSGEFTNNLQQVGIVSENNSNVTLDDQNYTAMQSFRFNEEINSVIDSVVDADTGTRNYSNFTLTDAIESTENVNEHDESKESNEFKERLLALTGQHNANDYESTHQTRADSFQDLSSVERPREVIYQNNIRFDVQYYNNGLNGEVFGARSITDRQTERNTYALHNNEGILNIFDGIESSNSRSIDTNREDERRNKSLTVVNSPNRSVNVENNIIRKTVVMQDEQNIENVIFNPNVIRDSISIHVSSRRGIRRNDNNCNVV